MRAARSADGLKIMEQHIHKICEAVDCQKPASGPIEMSLGKNGNLVLSVCTGCLRKFTDDSQNERHGGPATSPAPRRQMQQSFSGQI